MKSYSILSCLLLLIFYKTQAQEAVAVKGLFDTDEVLQLTLKGDVRNLLIDRTGTPKNHALTLLYKREDSSEINIPVEVKTRGHFRRLKGNCFYPPLMVQFPKEGAGMYSVFNDQTKLKLVMPCKGDEFIIREWLVYKLYNLVTPTSFKARLVKLKLQDDKSNKPSTPFYGMLLEAEKQMAKRNKLVAVEKKVKPEETQFDTFLTMSVFEYLIGNTDWSIQYQQNIKLVAEDSNAITMPVPYDFDHAGIVNCPYAHPAEQLLMSSVRQRRYRGYCIPDMKVFESVIALFNSLKNDIYTTYTNCKLIDEKYLKSTMKYLDEFYTTINNPKQLQREFGYPCDKYGTGNVVIKGLKDD